MLSSLPHVKKEFPFTYKSAHWLNVLANAAPLPRPLSLTDSDSSDESPNSPTQTPPRGTRHYRGRLDRSFCLNRDSF
jgi:hypothetical protein